MYETRTPLFFTIDGNQRVSIAFFDLKITTIENNLRVMMQERSVRDDCVVAQRATDRRDGLVQCPELR